MCSSVVDSEWHRVVCAVCVAHGTQGGPLFMDKVPVSHYPAYRFCCFRVHPLSPFSPPPTPTQVFIMVMFIEQYTLQTFELHYNISCQISLNVVCVVYVCTIHSLVLYRVLCEVLWMALTEAVIVHGQCNHGCQWVTQSCLCCHWWL